MNSQPKPALHFCHNPIFKLRSEKIFDSEKRSIFQLPEDHVKEAVKLTQERLTQTLFRDNLEELVDRQVFYPNIYFNLPHAPNKSKGKWIVFVEKDCDELTVFCRHTKHTSDKVFLNIL